jgi:hypothetical protein
MINKTKKIKIIELTQTNLDDYDYLFSAELRIMVRSHELGGDEWDVEVDVYRPVNSTQWTPDGEYSGGAYSTLAEAIAEWPELARAKDWVHGDDVDMW